MKKLLQSAAIALACVAMAGGVAAADGNISNTGPGSSNRYTCASGNALFFAPAISDLTS